MTGKTENYEIFVDGIGTMVFLGGLIRADMVRLVPDSNNPEKPTIKVVQKILISPQGFLQALGAMTELANKLKASGVFQQREEATGGAGAATATDEKSKETKREK